MRIQQIKISDEDIWYWYGIILESFESNLNNSEFCKLKNIDYKIFTNYKYRFIFKYHSNPKEYSRLYDLVMKYNSYNDDNLNSSQFCRKNNVSITDFKNMAVHVKYLKRIQELHKIKSVPQFTNGYMPLPRDETSSINLSPAIDKDMELKLALNQMKFIPISSVAELFPEPPVISVDLVPIEEPVQEFKKMHNEIELNIASGIKVVLSPDVDSMKIMKIINLLKEI